MFFRTVLVKTVFSEFGSFGPDPGFRFSFIFFFCSWLELV